MPFVLKNNEKFNKGQAQIFCFHHCDLSGSSKIKLRLVKTVAIFVQRGFSNFVAVTGHVTYFAYVIHVNMTILTNLLVYHGFRLLGIRPQKIDHPLTFLETKCEGLCLNFLESFTFCGLQVFCGINRMPNVKTCRIYRIQI